MRALIVEDDFSSMYVLQTLISRFGSYDVAINGLEAIKLFKVAFDDGRRYDLICLDINMPEMNGQEVLKRMREIDTFYGFEGSDRTKIVMVTAYDNYDNLSIAFEEQCDAFLVKPIAIEKFDQTLINLSLKRLVND